MMSEITLKDFRCFHEEQTARLAPLTLLIGENSTGKTSFLALIRVLWEIAYGAGVADFKVPPYDLGSFDEIAYNREEQGGQADRVEVGFTAPLELRRRRAAQIDWVSFRVELAMRGTAPAPIRRRLSTATAWAEQSLALTGRVSAHVGTGRGKWELKRDRHLMLDDGHGARSWERLLLELEVMRHRSEGTRFIPKDGSSEINDLDLTALANLRRFRAGVRRRIAPFCSAPVRSTPLRTYDPFRSDRDPVGEYVPMYLAETATQADSSWDMLKSEIERFGKAAGLFDEIQVYRFGTSASAPFQLQVRKGHEGPWRNLIDVGYGVSQVLPVITELLRPDAPQLSLWQQPEVHLHPSAQAALATFFCGLAADGKQLIVETHSDHLLDRVRMDVRDGKIGLKPDDVSVLYFERTGLDVQIHSLRFDDQGNVLNAPPGYRQFFLEEVNRSLGL